MTRVRALVLLAVGFAASGSALSKARPAPYSTQEAQVAGVREGFRVTTERIRSRLEAHQARLDAVFSFTPFLRDGMLPPVVEEFGPQTVLGSGGQSREAFEVSFRIAEPARFAIAAPTWRDYLVWEAGEVPRRARKVRKEDAELYASAVVLGEKQALEVFRDRLTQLRTALRGMRFAQALIRQGVLQEAQVHRRGDVVRVSDSVVLMGLRREAIAQPSMFRPEDQWGQPEVRPAAGLPPVDREAQ